MTVKKIWVTISPEHKDFYNRMIEDTQIGKSSVITHFPLCALDEVTDESGSVSQTNLNILGNRLVH